MLKEISPFRDYDGHENRRSFTDSDMDLYVWFRDQEPERFHLTYNKKGRSHSISWDNETGFEKWRFAQIEALVTMLGLPSMFDALFMQDYGEISASLLANRFLHASENIAPWLADFIYARLLEYPERHAMHINQGTILRSF